MKCGRWRESREYWAQVDDRVRQKYGISLQQYIENGIEESKPFTYLALQLGVNHQRLHEFAKKNGIKRKPKQTPKPIKRELKDIRDIEGLDIKDISCLAYRKQIDWTSIEDKVMQEYKAPSLPAYLLYEHQFNDKSINDLRKKLGVNYDALREAMCELGIPIKEYRGRRQKFDEKEFEELNRRYWQDNLTQKEIAKEQGVTRQTIHLRMKKLGIPRKNNSQALLGKPSHRKGRTYEEICGIEKAQQYKENISARTKGRTFEELYGQERAQQIKTNLSQKLSGRAPWNKGLTKKDSRVAKYIDSRRGKPFGMKGKHHSEETRRKMSEAHKRRLKQNLI